MITEQSKLKEWIKHPRFYLLIGIVVFLMISVFVNALLNNKAREPLDDTDIRTIRYQVDGQYPPFSYVHDNDLVGFDFYLTNILFPSNQYILEYSTDDWEKVYQRVTNDEIDIAGIIAVTEERKNDVLYSNTLFKSYVSVYTKNDFSISSLDELRTLRVGVGKGYYTEAILRDELKIDYIAYSDVYQALLDLEAGKLDAIFENNQLIKTLMIKNNLSGKIIERISQLYPRDHAYAISKEQAELIPFINTRVDELKKSGVFEEIYLNYFYEHSDSYISQRNQETFWWVAFIAFTLILLFFGMENIIHKLKQRLQQNINQLELSNLELADRYAEIRNLAYTNTVTGLPNRNQLRHDLTLITNNPQSKAVLIMVDLERFNEVNDAFGHRIGDSVLKEITRRFIAIVPPEGKVYNLNSQQFIFVGQPLDREIFKIKSAEILSSIHQPILVEDNLIQLNASMGIVFYPEHGHSFDELIRSVDIAMVDCKKHHKGGYTIYDQEMGKQFLNRLDLHRQMRSALDQNEFELYYQAVVQTTNKTITGFEALIRHNHPQLGIQAPSAFIDALEESRLIIPVGYWIIQEACSFINQLNNQYHSNYTVSINISSIQLRQDDFVQQVQELLTECVCDAKQLIFEITESVTLDSMQSSISKLQELRRLGIRIAIDDFGTGYSSLSYIKDLPLDIIKIDKSFVQALHQTEKNQVLATTIINIGHALGLKLIAEGVETEDQLQFLVELGCDAFQGYLFSKPIPEATIKNLIESKQASM